MSESPVLFSSDDEDAGPSQEAKVLKKFQMMIQGVPPPISVTMSKLSANEMLEKYKENESSFCCTTNKSTVPRRFACKNSTPLVYYSNSSQTSEEIANLFQKVQSRYIYSETLSSCNIWFDAVIKTNSSKKQSSRRNGFGLSPGSRLSHLARRRQIFSCENLQQLANCGRRHRLEIRKENALTTKTLERNKTVDSFKRALFTSPDNEDSKKLNFSSDTIRRNLFPSSDGANGGSSRTVGAPWQFVQNGLGGTSAKKRKRTESRESNGPWSRRALTFTEEDSNKYQETNSRNAKVISELQLSLHHKNKLLWAVSTTLKEKNMSSRNPQFKTCASALFMICRKNLGEILTSKVEGGTSEKMIYFAREQIGEIFEKLGISTEDGSREDTAVDSGSNLYLPSVPNGSDIAKTDSDSIIRSSFVAETTNSFCNVESPLNVHTGKDDTNISEKENIDVNEDSSSFCQDFNQK